jgi:hypothetical protein
VATALVPELRAVLDDAARRATAGLPDERRPVLVSKEAIRRVLACERQHAGTPTGTGLHEPVVRGIVLDRLLHHHVHGDGTALPAGSALPTAVDALLAERADDVLAWLDDPATGGGERRDDLESTADELAVALQAWGPIDPASWPRCEERVRVDLGSGAVRASARLDLAIGGSPTSTPLVIVEVKSGTFGQDHRDGLFWYALLAALRHGQPPAAVVAWSPVSGVWSQRVDAGVLRAAAIRAERAITSLGELAAGRPPVPAPGRACRWCAIRAGCDVAAPEDEEDGDDR